MIIRWFGICPTGAHCTREVGELPAETGFLGASARGPPALAGLSGQVRQALGACRVRLRATLQMPKKTTRECVAHLREGIRRSKLQRRVSLVSEEILASILGALISPARRVAASGTGRIRDTSSRVRRGRQGHRLPDRRAVIARLPSEESFGNPGALSDGPARAHAKELGMAAGGRRLVSARGRKPRKGPV